MRASSRHLEADTSSSQPRSILAADSKKKSKMLTHKQLEAVLEALEVDRDKWSKCVHDVIDKGEDVNSYAVCTHSVGVPDKESKKESAKYNFRTRLREAQGAAKGQKFEVVLIQEGLGNFKDAFYYTKESLQAATSQFEGKKIYADHPTALSEEIQPERSTRDILGYFEDVTYVEVEERGELHATLCIPAEPAFDWARAMANTAIQYRESYGDKDFVGLSINASGDADEQSIDEMINSVCDACKPKLIEAKEKGIETVRVVKQIEDAISCDLVTEAGAGGKILKLMEDAKVMAKKKVKEADMEKKEADGAGAADDSGAGSDHADADQDTKLFKQLFDKYMGDGGDDDSEGEGGEESHKEDMESEESECGDDGAAAPHPDAKGVKEKYEAYQSMGMKPDQAMTHAVAHHKMEKMKQKKEASVAGQKDPSQMNPTKESKEDESESHKESKSKEVVQLAGRVALLERQLNKANLDKVIEGSLVKSGLPRKATKLFMEKAGSFKSEADFKAKLRLFTEAYTADRDEEISFIGGYEKTSTERDEVVSFEDCVK